MDHRLVHFFTYAKVNRMTYVDQIDSKMVYYMLTDNLANGVVYGPGTSIRAGMADTVIYHKGKQPADFQNGTVGEKPTTSPAETPP
jgi:hypothetical protein